MFKLETDPRYWWPVTILLPDPQQSGQFVEHQCEAEFRWLSSREYEAWLNQVVKSNIDDAQAMCGVWSGGAAVCVGFRGVAQADGTPLESSAASLERLLVNDALLARRFAKAFFDSRAKAAEKNS